MKERQGSESIIRDIKRKTLMLRKQQNLTPDNQCFNKNNLALLNNIS